MTELRKMSNSTATLIDNKLSQVVGTPFTLASSTVAGAYTIVVTDATGLSANETFLVAEDGSNPRSYVGKIASISTNTLTMYEPLPSVFTTSAVAFEIITDLAANGSVTPTIFDITNGSSVPIDITRVILKMVTATAPLTTDFGDINNGITAGCVLRKKHNDGTYHNIATWRTNADMALWMYDLDLITGVGGEDGVKGRMTFGSSSKHGAVIRLDTSEKLEFVIQDDLSSLTSFEIMAQGYIAE